MAVGPNPLHELALTALTALTAALLVACSGPDTRASNTTTTMEPLGADEAGPTLEESRGKVARMSLLYSELGDGVDAAGQDCDQVARSIDAWSGTHRTEIKAISSELATLPEDQVKELAPTLESAMRRAALQVKDANDRCPNHQGLFDAISRIPR